MYPTGWGNADDDGQEISGISYLKFRSMKKTQESRLLGRLLQGPMTLHQNHGSYSSAERMAINRVFWQQTPKLDELFTRDKIAGL